MGDTKRVERDTKRPEADMPLTIDGDNKTAAQWAYEHILSVAEKEHRGRHDTWGAARDRAAQRLGIKRSYAKRIWNRWQDMRDVSGETILAIAARYDSICDRMDAQTEHNNKITESLRHGSSNDEKRHRTGN